MTRPTDSAGDFPLLATCRPEDREAFARFVERQRFHKGESILIEGDSSSALWLLVSGRCEVVKRVNGQGVHQLAVLEPGHFFGEMSFLAPAPHCATVRALTEVEVARLTSEAFEQLRETSPEAAHRIVSSLVPLLSERLRRMNERAIEDRHSHEWHDFRARLFAGDFN